MRVTYLSVAVLDLAEIRSYIAVDTPDTAQQIGNQLAQAITDYLHSQTLENLDELKALAN